MPRRVPKRRDTLASWLRLWTQQDRDALGLDPRNLNVDIRHPDRQLAAVSRVRPGYEPFLPTSSPAALTRSRFGNHIIEAHRAQVGVLEEHGGAKDARIIVFVGGEVLGEEGNGGHGAEGVKDSMLAWTV